MINKKINRLLSSVLGTALIIGIVQVPAFADDTLQSTSSYTTSSSVSCIVSKDNSIEKNGLKISIDKIIATKHKLKVTIKIENQNSFDEAAMNNIETLLTYGDTEENGSGMGSTAIDDKTLLVTLDKDVDNGELPEKGTLRIDIVMPKYKINVGMEANVDFSEAFKNTIEKDISVKIPEFNFTLEKLESNALGTQLAYSAPVNSLSDKNYDFSNNYDLILKVGDKMYPAMNSRGCSSKTDDNLNMGIYESDAATYDKVKDQNNISVIPVTCNMTNKEINNLYREIYKNEDYKKLEASKETANNINYTKNIDFSDGSKGQISNIERNDNSVKVYCKGTTEKESLLMATTMSLYPKFEEGKVSYDDYNSMENMSFYKDPKDSLGYIVEFDNVPKDKSMDLNFDEIIKQIDKYTIGNEIQLSK
jgi:hypothetical protein